MNDPNKHEHIFGNPRHNLDRLVEEYGSREAAWRAIQEAVATMFTAGALVLNPRGVFEVTLDVGRSRLTVRGMIRSGSPRIGSAWI
jgi:hypothetical protein